MVHQVQPGPSKKRCSKAKNEQLRCTCTKWPNKENHTPDNVSLPRKLPAKVKVLKSCLAASQEDHAATMEKLEETTHTLKETCAALKVSEAKNACL
jgi:hypothetical protein